MERRFRGYEEIKFDSQVQAGEFLWQIDKQINMIVSGTVPVCLGWQRVTRKLEASFDDQ